MKQANLWPALFVFGWLGFLSGGHIEGRKKEKVALDWAVLQVSKCESAKADDPNNSISFCLELAISKAEDERRAWEQQEGQDALP